MNYRRMVCMGDAIQVWQSTSQVTPLLGIVCGATENGVDAVVYGRDGRAGVMRGLIHMHDPRIQCDADRDELAEQRGIFLEGPRMLALAHIASRYVAELSLERRSLLARVEEMERKLGIEPDPPRMHPENMAARGKLREDATQPDAAEALVAAATAPDTATAMPLSTVLRNGAADHTSVMVQDAVELLAQRLKHRGALLSTLIAEGRKAGIPPAAIRAAINAGNYVVAMRRNRAFVCSKVMATRRRVNAVARAQKSVQATREHGTTSVNVYNDLYSKRERGEPGVTISACVEYPPTAFVPDGGSDPGDQTFVPRIVDEADYPDLTKPLRATTAEPSGDDGDGAPEGGDDAAGDSTE